MVWTCGVKCDDGWLKKRQQLVVEDKAGRGRGSKSWLKCVRMDQ